MASQLIGRAACPECGFASAHVKRSEKTLYRHCPDCGAQYMATGARREADLLAKTRLSEPQGGQPPAVPEKTPEKGPSAPAPATPTTTAAPPSASAPKGRGLFGMR